MVILRENGTCPHNSEFPPSKKVIWNPIEENSFLAICYKKKLLEFNTDTRLNRFISDIIKDADYNSDGTKIFAFNAQENSVRMFNCTTPDSYVWYATLNQNYPQENTRIFGIDLLKALVLRKTGAYELIDFNNDSPPLVRQGKLSIPFSTIAKAVYARKAQKLILLSEPTIDDAKSIISIVNY